MIIKLNKRLIFCVFAVIFMTVTAVNVCFAQLEEKSKCKQEQGICVPIIMYHGVLKDESRQGEYVISPVTLEKDIIYLLDNGYTPVKVNDLIRYVNYGGKLPDKPVVLTFDDGMYNNFTYVYPLLEKYGICATISVVGSFTVTESESADMQNPAYSYLTWDNINQMRESGLVEFCNHTYDSHSLGNRVGIHQLEGECYEDYRKYFLNDVFKLQNLFEENCGFKPNCFTYPYGASGDYARRLVKNCGFEASLGVEEKPNYVKAGQPDCLFDLNRYNRPSGISTEKFMEKALKG